MTQFEIGREEKEKLEHEAVHQVLTDLLDGDQIEALFLEFDARETKEALFAYQCDKLECDLQSKLYDEEGCVNLQDQDGNDTMQDERVQKLLKEGNSWSSMWLKFGQQVYPYDENFRAISNYAIENKVNR